MKSRTEWKRMYRLNGGLLWLGHRLYGVQKVFALVRNLAMIQRDAERGQDEGGVVNSRRLSLAPPEDKRLKDVRIRPQSPILQGTTDSSGLLKVKPRL